MLVADLLCGAGGSSTGCERALRELGLEMDLVCVNHWGVAIDTHQRNHPQARHYVQDIATVRPHLIVPEGYLDLLMASPTCTHHSVARGGRPTSDQQRSDPWHIITWLTELRVYRLIIENVWEFIGWGPVDDETGRPIPERKGDYFRIWIDTLRRLGFEPEWRKLNAADYGDATTRQRFILMARSDGRRVIWPGATHAKRPAAGVAAHPTLQAWKPAREIIDWSIRGRSIFNRKKPLAPKTLARIYAGAVNHDWPAPFLVVLRNHMAAQGLEVPLPTIAANGQHIGLAQPVIVKQNFRRDVQGVDVPAPTITTVARIGLAEPVVLNLKKGTAPAGADEPLPTQTAAASHLAMVEPFVLSQGAGGVPRGIANPVPTIPPRGAHALISPYYGSGSGETCVSAGEPLPTVTSKGRFGIVVPVTQSGGGPGPRDVEEPLPTMTTAKGGEFAVVMPVTHHDDSDRARSVGEPLPTVTGANRGELAFITAQHGERPGQAPRVHSVDAPAPTVAATGHVDLVEGVEGYDILFRMLQPHELAAAMGFTGEDQAYEFVGTKTEQIKQIGNAVCVAKMKACVGSIMADAAPRRRPVRETAWLEAAE
jgi:DNA (cytosine-5)-methyltransferase 1